MSHHEDALNELTAETHHAHATSLQREVGQLRIVKEGLTARVKDLEVRIADLQQRLERAIDANVTLRQENARLRLAETALRAVEFVDGQDVAAGMGGMMEQVCPWCDKVGTPDDGWAHNPGCIRQAALEASQAKRTQMGVDATLRKAGDRDGAP